MAGNHLRCAPKVSVSSRSSEVPTQLDWIADFTCVADMPHRRRLRSASTEQLDVPTCRRSTIGSPSFPVDGAKVWNGLPSEVTSAVTKLLDFQLHSPFLIIISHPRTVVLAIVFTV